MFCRNGEGAHKKQVRHTPLPIFETETRGVYYNQAKKRLITILTQILPEFHTIVFVFRVDMFNSVVPFCLSVVHLRVELKLSASPLRARLRYPPLEQ